MRVTGVAGIETLSRRTNDFAALGPPQECRIDEDVDHVSARREIEPPQPRRLLHRQLKAGHFDELASHPIDECC
jgi:hypothetical protein